MAWLVPSLFPPSVGVVLCLLGSMPEREWWCYNNTEKPISFLVVEGRVGGLGYAGVAVGQDCIHLSTVSDENV